MTSSAIFILAAAAAGEFEFIIGTAIKIAGKYKETATSLRKLKAVNDDTFPLIIYYAIQLAK